jgi:glycosyltransferase involved in cell wall biosynthesis
MEPNAPTLAILAPYPFVPARSGGHKAVSAYVRYLSAVWPSICICSEGNDPLPGVEMIPLFANHPAKYIDPRVGWRIRKCLEKRQIRFLGLQHHYHGLLLQSSLQGLDIKVFVFSHNIEFERWRSIGKWWWPIMKWTERRVYHWADAVFFISWHEQQRAPAIFNMPAQKCHYAPYPIDQAQSPAPSVDERAKIIERHQFAPEDRIFLFFGPQTYAPNLQAVEDIVFRIHPILRQKAPFSYRILLCGGGLPEHYQHFRDKEEEGIHYLGFVEDIETYIAAADLILNPVNVGGGVKTKLVEAVALGKTVISTVSGALGVEASAYAEKLIIIEDDDWEGFADAVISARGDEPTTASFYQKHYGPNAVAPIIEWMQAQ